MCPRKAQLFPQVVSRTILLRPHGVSLIVFARCHICPLKYDVDISEASAVKSYLSFLGTTYSGKYNATGRAYPDVSSMGENVQVYVDKSVESVAGTR